MTAISTAITMEEDKKAQVLESAALDEDQIVEEVKGNTIEAYFYEFKNKGRVTVGISYSGVKWVARQMAGQGHPISVEHVDVSETADGKSWLAMAMAKDTSTGEKRWGNAQQRKFDAKGEENEFAYTLVVSKAQRNALRQFIPETAIQEGYKAWNKGDAAPVKPEAKAPPKDVTKDAKVSTPATAPAGEKRKVTYEEVQYALRDLAGSVELVKGETPEIVATVKVQDMSEDAEGYAAIRDALKEFKPKISIEGSSATFSIKAEV